MKLSNVAALYGMRLRAQLGQELLALVGIAAGVSLLFAALVANTSLTGSFERITQSVVGDARYQVTARGQGVDERLVGEIRELAGVRAAAAFLEVRAEIEAPRGRRSILLVGATPEFADLAGSLTRQFSYAFLVGVRAVAVPTPLAETLGLALGQRVEMAVHGRRVSAPMGAKLQASDIGGLIDSPFVVGQLGYVQELSGLSGRVSRISVTTRPGHPEVERQLRQLAAGSANVRPADFEAKLFKQAATPTNQSTMMFSLFSALVGFLFACSAVLLTVPQRRRLIADLRTEGYGRGTAAKVLAFDALVVGVVASALGILLGVVVSEHVFSNEPGFLGYAFAFGTNQIVTPWNIVIAAASGIVASCAAVLGPMASASENPAAPSRDRGAAKDTANRLALLGALLALLTGGVIVFAPASALAGFGGLALLTAATLALLPWSLALLVRVIDALTRGLRSVIPFIALADLRDPATRARSIAVAATGAVAVFATVALQGAHADLQRGLDRTSHDIASNAPLWIVAPGDANLLATTPFARPSFAVPPQVTNVRAYRGAFLDVADRRAWVVAPPASSRLPIEGETMTEGDAQLATRRLRTGGWAVLSEAIGNELHLHVGDRFVLPSPVPTSMRVAALSSNLGWPPGAVVLNASDFARAWGSTDVSALQVTAAPGVSIEAAARALRSALGPDNGLVVETSTERERNQRAASRRGLARMTQIAALVLVAAALAMGAVMAGMIWQRRAFLAAMKIEGYSTSELWRSLLLEASVLIGAGCGIGAVFGLGGQALLSRALTHVTGFPVMYEPAAVSALAISLGLVAITVAIVAVFGVRAARISAAHGLS